MFRIFIISVFFALHPVHVSLMSIEYSAEDEVFNGFLKIYYDDFLLDYKAFQGTVTGVEIDPSSDTAIKQIGNYLDEKVHFYAGKNKLKPDILDISLSGNELKMNLRYEMKRKSGEFRVTNSILADIYGDQSNLLIFRYYNFEEGVKMTPEKREHVFKIK